RVRTARVAAAVTDLLGGFGELAALFLSALGREGEVVVCLDELLLTVFGEQHVDERGFLLRGALPSVAVQITRERVALRAEVLAEVVGRPVEFERDGRDLATDERQRHVRD